MRVLNCKGSYKEIQHKNSTSYIITIPLGWSDETKRYERYTECMKSAPDAIVAIKEINEYLYFGGLPEKERIAYFRHRKLQQRKTKNLNKYKTFAQVAADFIKQREEQKNVSLRTIDTYKEVIKRINPYIGHVPIQDITTQDIDTMYQEMRSSGERNLSGKPLSGTTLAKTHSILNLVFASAVNHDIIYKNPAQRVNKPKPDTKEKVCLTVEQAQQIFNHYYRIKNDDAHNIGIFLGLLCGLRLSETLALTWDDYDGEFLYITKSLEKDSKTTKTPKNGESRTVAVPPILAEILDSWKKAQRQYFKSIELCWTRKVPIVNSLVGSYILQSNFQRWIQIERKNNNLPPFFTYHLLRHTYTTFIYVECGIDEKTTRDLTGHKSAKAFSTYVHSNNEWKAEAVSRLNNLITNQQ